MVRKGTGVITNFEWKSLPSCGTPRFQKDNYIIDFKEFTWTLKGDDAYSKSLKSIQKLIKRGVHGV